MPEKRIQELRAMLDRGTIQNRHIEEMLKALESNNVLMSAVNNVTATVATKVDPQVCPGCGSPYELKRAGSKWKFLCSANKGLNSQCKKEGHWMLSRKDAVRIWNEVK